MKYCSVLLYIMISAPAIVLSANPDQWANNENVIPLCVHFQKADTHANDNADYHKKHHISHHQMPQPDLSSFSADQLIMYFVRNGFTQEQILAQRTLYMSDEFVKIAKGCVGYQSAITALHRKCHEMSGAGKWFRSWTGTYCSGLTRRIDFLYEEIQRNKQATLSAERMAAQRIEQRQKEEASSYITADKVQHNLSNEACYFAYQYGIDAEELICIHGPPSEQQLRAEFIDILNTTAAIAQKNGVMLGENLFVDAIGYGTDIGITARQAGDIYCARRWADFCWTVLDCMQSVGEGVLIGARNTLQTLAHPLQTAKNLVVGIATLTGALVHAVGIVGESTYLYVTDTQQYCIRRDEILLELQAIAEYAQQKIKTTSSHEIIKQGTAFIIEGVLLNKVCTVAHELSSRMIPVAQKSLEYIAREEALSCLADGEVMAVKVIPVDTKQASNTIAHFTESPHVVPNSGGSIVSEIVHDAQEIMAAIAKVEPNRIHHITAEKHAWDRICKNTSNWDEVKDFITKTMLEGTNSTYKGELSKILQISQENVEVVYKILGTGRLIITDAWVKTR